MPNPLSMNHSLLRLLLPILVGAAPGSPASDPGSEPRIPACRIDAIQYRSESGLVLVITATPGSYWRIESRRPDSTEWRPVRLHLPTTGQQEAVPVGALPDGAGRLFRVASLPMVLPGDADADGLDDVFELRRNHVLDPLRPDDALEDPDADGLDSLTEYLLGREVAPPHPSASQVFETISALLATRFAPLPSLIRVRGFESNDDGWGGWFRYLPEDRRPPDGAIVADLGPGVPGRLERLVDAGAPILSGWWRPPADGVGDAGPALQRALSFLQGRPAPKLVIGPGRYRLATRIAYADPALAVLVATNLTDFEIDGTGATLLSREDGEFLMLLDCRRGTVKGLTFEGSGSDRAGTGPNYAMIQLTGQGSDLHFVDCRLFGFMHGISHLHGPKTTVRVTIRDCYFEDGGDTRHAFLGIDGAAISGIGDDWTVENNVLHECARGIEVENTASTHPISRVRIVGNRLTNIRNLGIMAFLGGVSDPSGQQSDIVIRDNVLFGKPDRHRYADGTVIPVMPISLGGGSRWIITGNTCRDGDFAGISLYSTQAPITDSVVSDNVVADMSYRGIQIVSDRAWPTTGIVVANNRVSRCGDRGLLLAANNVSAQGNLVEEVGVAGIAVGDSWLPEVDVRDVAVRNNVIRQVAGGAPAILVLAHPTGTIISGNDLSDAAVGIRIHAPDTQLSPNSFLRIPLETEWLE